MLTPEERRQIYEEEEARIQAEKAARISALLHPLKTLKDLSQRPQSWEYFKKSVFILIVCCIVVILTIGSVMVYQHWPVRVNSGEEILCGDALHKGNKLIASTVKESVVARRDARSYNVTRKPVTCKVCLAEHTKINKASAAKLIQEADKDMLQRKYTAAAEAYEKAASLDSALTTSARSSVKRAKELARQAQEKAEREAERERLMALVDGDTSAYRKLVRLLQKHPEWDEEICAVIAQRKVRIGMTQEQAIAAWGRPYDINRTSYSFGVHEQWVYGEYGSNYLYFEDGILTTVQN